MTIAMCSLNSFIIFWRIFTSLFANLKCARNLHESMIAKIMNAPINLFFDVTPIGKILNRFSKDLDTLESLGYYTSWIQYTLFVVLSALIIAAISNYLILLFIPFVGYGLYRLIKFGIPA